MRKGIPGQITQGVDEPQRPFPGQRYRPGSSFVRLREPEIVHQVHQTHIVPTLAWMSREYNAELPLLSLANLSQHLLPPVEELKGRGPCLGVSAGRQSR